MTDDNLIFMRENYPEHIMPFILKNINDYNSIINEDSFDFNEMLLILDKEIDDSIKINLLKHTTENVSIQQKNYSNDIKKYILKNNLDIHDIPFLLSSFLSENGDVKNIIKQIAIDNVDNILDEQYTIPFELLLILFKEEEVSNETKRNLFVLSIKQMDKEQIEDCLEALQMQDFLSLFDGKRPKVEINSVNEQILNIFEENKWATFDVDKDDSNYYRAIGRRMNKDKNVS